MPKASFYCTVNNAGNQHGSTEPDLIAVVAPISINVNAKTIAVDYDKQLDF